MKILYAKPDDLPDDPKNARTHSDAQIDKIVASIVEFGWTIPALFDDVIRAGHGRKMAAKRIYANGGTIYHMPGEAAGGKPIPKGKMPYWDCTGWTKAQRKAYSVADNQLALEADWDDVILRETLMDLGGLEFDLDLLGFDNIDEILAAPMPKGATDPDDVPPLADPISEAGEIWQLGKHRLICGSSTDAATVALLMGHDQPMLMVTDPPYGVDYDPNWRNEAERADGSKIGAKNVGRVQNDDQADWTDAWALFAGDVAYVWHGEQQCADMNAQLFATGLNSRNLIVWGKPHLIIGRGHYHSQHESCWYAVRKGKTAHWTGDRKQSTLWDDIQPVRNASGHGTQKPIECMKRPIENNSRKGDFVYDPFSGSGTTIIAGEMTGRYVLACEIDPRYVDAAIRRWQEYTGQAAVLIGDGRTFEEIEAARAK